MGGTLRCSVEEVKGARGVRALRAIGAKVNAFACWVWARNRNVGITSVSRRYSVGVEVGIDAHRGRDGCVYQGRLRGVKGCALLENWLCLGSGLR